MADVVNGNGNGTGWWRIIAVALASVAGTLGYDSLTTGRELITRPEAKQLVQDSTDSLKPDVAAVKAEVQVLAREVAGIRVEAAQTHTKLDMLIQLQQQKNVGSQ